MDMNIFKYLAFTKTVEYGSFTRAAEALHYTQSGVSRMVSDLERDSGLTLLTRSKFGVSLTSDGCKILPLAKKLCANYEQLQSAVDDIRGLQTGLIRIGIFSSVASQWLPKIITAFRKDHPGIEYELLLGDYPEVEGWLEEGRIDCGFIALPTHYDFETICLERDFFKAVLPVDHPLAALERVPLAEIAKKNFILIEKDERTNVSRAFAQNGIKPNVHYTTWDDSAALSMIECGLGVSIMPQLILKRMPYNVALRELDTSIYRDIGLILKGAQSSAATRRFLTYLDHRND